MRVRLLLVDDDPLVCAGLAAMLGGVPELELVGQAGDGREAVDAVRDLRPDVVLMDIGMPVLDGVAATAAIRQEVPDVEVLALTSVLEDDKVVGAVRAGAIGYLLKDTRADDLIRAIKGAAAGQAQLSLEAATRLMREVRAPDAPEPLTERETEVLRHLALGKSNKEIARSLSVNESTVKSHVSNILAKLGVEGRTQAALHAVRIGLVPATALDR